MRTLRNIALVCLWLPVSSFAQGTQPVIDMHLHGAFEIGSFKLTSGGRPLSLPCYPQPCESQPALAQSRQDVQRLTFAYMDEFNIVLGALSDRPPSVHEWQVLRMEKSYRR